MVEDDPPLRTLTARALQEHGYQVRPASSGPEMWVAMDAGPADLIVLDIMLPGTNGIDLCRQVRRKSDIPIIFISARGSEPDRIVGLELGADDYLPKPFGTRELIARIRAILRRSGMERGSDEVRESEARFDGWVVNFPRRELRSPSGAVVDLTGAEFDLLSSFISHPQRVIARERLIELSRTRMGDSSDRSIDVLVSRLRRKLSTQDNMAPITTVRGIGYMFNAEVSRA
nr:response regulator transcription factor [Sphingobium fontiphilum]